MDTPYTSDFYRQITSRAVESAKVILPEVLEVTAATSCVDVGCGTGAWLKVARDLGVTEIRGLDGDHVERSQLLIREAEFTPVDLASELPPGRFDLAICLEVGEHLPRWRADGFVADLCRLADAVLFSAAIPNQTGPGHVNEQWQSEWKERFANCGYAAFDFVRPRLWSDGRVDVWYRQNTLLYVNRARYDILERISRTDVPPLLDVVHPENWLTRSAEVASMPRGVRGASLHLYVAVRNAARARLGRRHPRER